MPVTVFLIISVITLCFPSTWSFGLSRGIATFTYKRLVQTCLHGSVDGDDSNCTTTTQHNVPPEAFKSHSLKGLQNWPALATGVLLGTGLTLFALIAPTMVSSLYPATSEQQETYYHTDDITAPVILFQNILSDLEVDYIDKIDPAKLFKTGMKAMLQSLDPYTEFEDLNTAKTMQESVAGKYGGVGLIIGNIKQPSSPQQMQMNSDTSGAPATESTDTDKTKKSSGVFVVDAFEGYAYDSNMRPGDRLVSIDSVECSGMDVEQVRDLLRGVPDTQVSFSLL